METKTTTSHSISRGTVQIYSSSITAVCQTSGDSIELSLPYGALREALNSYLVNSLGRSSQEEIIGLLTEDLRKREEQANA
jgi:hypothetical protein